MRVQDAADLRVVFCVSGTLEILAWWLEHGEAIPIAQMAEILDALAIAPHVPTELPPGALAGTGKTSRVD